MTSHRLSKFTKKSVTGKKCGCIIILLTETVLLSRSSTLG